MTLVHGPVPNTVMTASKNACIKMQAAGMELVCEFSGLLPASDLGVSS